MNSPEQTNIVDRDEKCTQLWSLPKAKQQHRPVANVRSEHSSGVISRATLKQQLRQTTFLSYHLNHVHNDALICDSL